MEWKRRQQSELQRALKRSQNPSILSLALGLPAAGLFPLEELCEAACEVLGGSSSAAQYGPPKVRLKEHIAGLMALRGVKCSPEQIFVTAGAQQALDLLGKLLADNQDFVMVDEAVYPGFQQVMQVQGVRMAPARTDGEGPEPDSVKRIMKQGPRFFYTMSTGHNPLSWTLSQDRKQDLVDLAERHRVAIIEDDVYGFLRYGGDPSVPMKALAPCQVFYVGSFSKILAPALRVGWIVAPAECLDTLSVLKEAADIDTATIAQHILLRYLERNSMDKRIEGLRAEYTLRREAMRAALTRHMSEVATWREPDAGFFFWVESELFENPAALLELALDRGVAFVPGSAFAVSASARCGRSIRLNFSHGDAGSFDEAVSRLARTVEARRTIASVI